MLVAATSSSYMTGSSLGRCFAAVMCRSRCSCPLRLLQLAVVTDIRLGLHGVQLLCKVVDAGARCGHSLLLMCVQRKKAQFMEVCFVKWRDETTPGQFLCPAAPAAHRLCCLLVCSVVSFWLYNQLPDCMECNQGDRY